METHNKIKEMFSDIEKEFDRAFNQPMLLDLSNDKFFEVFTQKRMEMLKEIQNPDLLSIRHLAVKLSRDIKNVHDDLRLLHKHRLIDFETRGRAKVPKLITKTVILNFE